MSSAVQSLSQGADDVSCEPIGILKSQGWLPGTWVKFSTTKPSFTPGALATCVKCGNTDWTVGFLKIGSMFLSSSFDDKYPNDNDISTWKADEGVQLARANANADVLFDNNHQLSRMGSGIVKLVINNTGVHKFYVYEKYDKEYRDTNGASGGVLDYEATIGGEPSLYVSNRGLLTCEKEDVGSLKVAYILCSVETDESGKFLVIVSS